MAFITAGPFAAWKWPCSEKAVTGRAESDRAISNKNKAKSERVLY